MKTFLRKLLVLAALTSPALVVYVGTTALLHAQAISGDLLGVVTDSSGAIVTNATVVATNLGTGVKSTTQTNSAGQYHFVNLPVGHYKVEVSGSGMAGGYKDVEVQLNHQSTANVMTSASGGSTTIEVTAEAPVIDTTTPQIQNTFTSKEVQDLPTATIGLGVLNLSL